MVCRAVQEGPCESDKACAKWCGLGRIYRDSEEMPHRLEKIQRE